MRLGLSASSIQLGASALLTILALSCAKGGDLVDGDDGDGNSGNGGTGSGAGGSGNGNGNGSGTMKTASATTAAEASTSTGPACDEDPCKLVEPQCGCMSGDACTINGSGDRVCTTAGSAAWDAACNAQNQCAPGMLCAGYAAGLDSCAKFCNSDADCEAPGGLCAVTLNDGMGGTLPDVTLCSTNCSFTTNGCAVAGTSCQLGIRNMTEPFTLCAPSGTGTQNTNCVDSSGCAPGFICLTTTAMDERCFQWCDVNAPACPGGLICQQLEVSAGVPLVIGTTAYGACT
ncbi:MAG: hypothetical protein HOV80_30765 [Polyangiaceae bacterium]|nr:hypothetical protein [Polyangiaceae bacterium]